MQCSFSSASLVSGLLLSYLVSISHVQNEAVLHQPGTGLCLNTGSALRPVALQATSKPALPPSSEDAVTASEGKATLPDGVTVELLGITDGKQDTKTKQVRWWKADGTLLASPPYAPTTQEKLYHGRQSRLAPNLTFSLKVTGMKEEGSFARTFTPGASMTGGSVNPFVPHDNSYILYEVDALFRKNLTTSSLHFNIAHQPWQTVATTATLPASVHASDGSTVLFGMSDKLDKEEIGSRAKRGQDNNTSQIVVTIQSEEYQSFDAAAHRVILIDDQNKTIVLDNLTSYTYDRTQKAKPELHMFVDVPTKLRGHIRQYALQTRSYQSIDFPNIHLKPIEPKN